MHRATASAVPLLLLVLAGCGAAETSAGGQPADGTDGTEGAATYPLTIENCGEEVVVDEPPQRVVLLESAPVTILDGLGVLDRVVSRAGSFPDGYYDDDLVTRIDAIPLLSEDIDASGHLMISQEVVIAEEPDLVLGLPDGVTRAGLADAGANVLVQPVYCPQGTGETTFETLYEQIETYGEVFDRPAEAAELVASLRARVAAVEEATADAPERTAAVLYPSVGGGPLYAYGTASMAHPQLTAAGFTNVFEDTGERVFEVSVEELIDRDPDVLVLLYQGEEAGVAEEVTSLPGADALRAVRGDDILVQLFNFTEPPTPLSVDGLERLVDHFGAG